jgi:hypothetical protein
MKSSVHPLKIIVHPMSLTLATPLAVFQAASPFSVQRLKGCSNYHINLQWLLPGNHLFKPAVRNSCMRFIFNLQRRKIYTVLYNDTETIIPYLGWWPSAHDANSLHPDLMLNTSCLIFHKLLTLPLPQACILFEPTCPLV